MSGEIRYRVEYLSTSRIARLRAWWSDVVEAIRTPPAKTYLRYVILKPGDAGYEEAPFRAVYDGGLRYEWDGFGYVMKYPTE